MWNKFSLIFLIARGDYRRKKCNKINNDLPMCPCLCPDPLREAISKILGSLPSSHPLSAGVANSGAAEFREEFSMSNPNNNGPTCAPSPEPMQAEQNQMARDCADVWLLQRSRSLGRQHFPRKSSAVVEI